MKKIIACVAFCLLTVLLITRTAEILTPKNTNRYYMLDQYLSGMEEKIDVQIYGSCHSYTSFYSPYMEEEYGISAFCMGNSGEIIPTTYLRMMEYFKKDAPKVALVEVWGLYAYETYSSHKNIFKLYMPSNIERLPFSLQKQEVIGDYETLDKMEMNSAIWHYKDRLLDKSLKELDFDYSFELTQKYGKDWIYEEMSQRFAYGGFCERPTYMTDSRYTPYRDVTDYYDYQAVVGADEMQEIEADIMKYINKIIELCEKNDVELIFYRTPYISKESELRKTNWFAKYCEERDIVFVDLEQEVQFDLATDFQDYQHLNKAGAIKATAYLSQFILSAME